MSLASRAAAPDREALLREALAQHWYHTIELAPGHATAGAVDLRRVAPRLLPRRLDGLRALDVGTFDGFWAFELERRGAEVVATDLERFDEAQWPPGNRATLSEEARDRGPGERFGLASALLGSRVHRVICAIEDLDAGRLGGRVHFANVGDLLLHLRDPVGGLEAVRRVLEPGGRLLSTEQLNVPLTLARPRVAAASFQAGFTRMNWWEPNLEAHRGWLVTAGFTDVRIRRIYRLDAHGRQARWHTALTARA